MTKDELAKIQTYMRGIFQNDKLAVKGRPKKDDSAEVYIGEEFIGVLFKDEEEGELSYNFQMAILDYDLE